MKMFKDLKEKLKEDLDKRTSPDAPLFTGIMVKMFFLRLLLGFAIYMIIDRFIVPLTMWKFIFIDLLFEIYSWVINVAKRRK